jgi:hypothetical protein
MFFLHIIYSVFNEGSGNSGSTNSYFPLKLLYLHVGKGLLLTGNYCIIIIIIIISSSSSSSSSIYFIFQVFQIQVKTIGYRMCQLMLYVV